MRLSHVIAVVFLLSVHCYPSTVRLDEFAVHGIDVSHHQSLINWDTVANQSVEFAFMKATEGGDWKDTLFCFNWVECDRVGLYDGVLIISFVRKRSPFIQAIQFY